MILRTAVPPARQTAATPAQAPAEEVLDQAVAHIGELAERLWAVRRLHSPGPSRSRSRFSRSRFSRGRFARGRVRCTGCGHAVPCPTLRAAAPGG